MASIYVEDAHGTLTLPDGRTLTLNGIGAYATLSDGQKVYVGGYGNLQYPALLQQATSTSFTINGGTTTVNLTPPLPDDIAISAVVSFASGPAAAGEHVQFWAQQTSGGGGAPFQFDTEALSGSAPYTAANGAFSVASPPFATGTTYNVWAVFPGDANNQASTSNIVVVVIGSS